MAAREKNRTVKKPRRVRHIMANGQILYNDEIANYVIPKGTFPPVASRIIWEMLMMGTPSEMEQRIAKEKAEAAGTA